MIIVKIDSTDGFHTSECQSGRTQCWKEGYIEIPRNLENKFLLSKGYCELIFKEGVLEDIVPRPEHVTKNTSHTSEIDDIYTMLIDQEYRLTLVELGVN